MRFWDSSAIVPLTVEEPASAVIEELLREDAEVIVWWGTQVECVVALNRLSRNGEFDDRDRDRARAVLEHLVERWSEVQPTDAVRSLAESLSGRYPLKAADALQLAAAYRWCGEETSGSELVCLDDRLRLAAQIEGFRVLPERSAAEIGGG